VPLTIGLAAYWIQLRHGIKFIFEVGDLWPEAPIQMGFVKNFFFKRLLFSLEKFLYEKSDAVVALSPMILRSIQEKVRNKRIHLIPNMADTDFYRPEAKDPALEEKYDVKGKFVVSYIGAIGLANGLDFFVECARASEQSNLPVQFLLCGDGALLNALQRIVKQYQLKNFSFVPFQNREGVKEIMNVTDAAFICYKPVPVLETGSPNKYFDGLAAGKLIIVNFGGWIKEEIEKRDCGIYINPNRPTDFIKKIFPYLNDTGHLSQSQQASRLLAEESYSRKILSERFARIFKS
jgi:glycosyltransferase involved in cell wall biosynthesis